MADALEKGLGTIATGAGLIIGMKVARTALKETRKIGKRRVKKKMIKTKITRIDGNKVSLAEFKKNAPRFYPRQSKVLVKNGKIIAKYSARTRRVSIKKR